MIPDRALRGNRFFPEDLADVRLGKPIDLVASKQAWFAVVQEARELVAQLPADELGCLYLDANGKLTRPEATGDVDRLTGYGRDEAVEEIAVLIRIIDRVLVQPESRLRCGVLEP